MDRSPPPRGVLSSQGYRTRFAQSLLRAGEAAGYLLGAVLTSLPRELHFTMMHSVHHFAMISAELIARGVPCRGDFGLAPSTLAWRRTQR